MRTRKKGISNVKILTAAAMLTALSIVIGIFCKTFLNFGLGLFRITFENFPIILSGIMFGPIVGMLVGVSSDVISFVLSTQTFAISPIVTLGAGLVGLVSGAVFHGKTKNFGTKRMVVSVFSAHIVGSMLVKSVGLFVYYGFLVVWRIPLYIVIATLEAIIICVMAKNKNFHHFMNIKGDKNDLR